ncbi:Hypothetical_protein [Hexamita inflata]|uniref:Hypothetical_protein n=1 Tax=Hexamita inflata TaxID=28002 RepID=A0AA86NL53_9EUKA|nr:Hypothetical protein HINF_LOCUS8750 [Hexamita inflata]
MNTQVSDTQLLNTIAHVLELNTKNIIMEEVIYKVLVLPDIMYQCLFQHLSVSLCLDQNMIFRQFCCLSLQYFPKNNKIISTQNEQSLIIPRNKVQSESRSVVYNQCRKLVPFQRRTESQEQIAFQDLFARAVLKVLGENSILSNKDKQPSKTTQILVVMGRTFINDSPQDPHSVARLLQQVVFQVHVPRVHQFRTQVNIERDVSTNTKRQTIQDC